MQLVSELGRHMSDAKFSVQQWQKYRFPKWAMFALVAAAFVAGWIGGVARGIKDGDESNRLINSALWSIAANERAQGNDYFSDHYHAMTVDSMVQERVKVLEADWVDKMLRVTSANFWISSRYEKAMNDAAVRFAERRLSLVPTVSSATLDTLRQQNKAAEIARVKESFAVVAERYSKLLGREIRADQLVPDAYLRRFIEEDQQGKKSH